MHSQPQMSFIMGQGLTPGYLLAILTKPLYNYFVRGDIKPCNDSREKVCDKRFFRSLSTHLSNGLERLFHLPFSSTGSFE